MRPNEELARTLEKVLEKRKHIRLRMGSREPFLARRPVGRSVLRDLSAKHDEYLYGKKRSRVAKEASEETARRKTMLEAAEAADKLRETTSVRGWSGAREIRKWRDREKKP